MTLTQILLLLVFSVLAGFTQRVTGFGFGILIMTIMPHLMPSYGEATALTGILAIICVSFTVARTFRKVQWKKLLPLMAIFLVVSCVSIHFVASIDSHLLKRILGGVLILVSIWFFVFSERVRIHPTLPMQAFLGSLSGVMGGFFSMQGPPVVVYFIASTDSKEQYIASVSMYFLIGNIFMTAVRASEGMLTACVLHSVIYAVPAILCGILLGRKVYDRIPVALLRKIVYAFLAVAGIVALVG